MFSPPGTEGFVKKPWWKRWYGVLAIVLAALFVLGVLVALFSPEKQVPTVIGKGVPEAQKILSAEGFTNVAVNRVDEKPQLEDSDYEVVRQDPLPGSSIRSVAEITLTAQPSKEAVAKLKKRTEDAERKEAEAKKRTEDAERKEAEAKKRAEAAERASLQKIDKREGYRRCVEWLTGQQQGEGTNEPIADSAKWVEKRVKDGPKYTWHYDLAFKAKLRAQDVTAYAVVTCRVYSGSYDGVDETFIDATQSNIERMSQSEWDAWR